MLKSNSVESTSKEIRLSEDERQAILDFCCILHHQHGSVTDVTASRLKQLIVLADMWDCKEALKPWILSELADHLSWFSGNESYTVPGSSMPASLPGFGLEDFITFAVAFGLDDLFFKATAAYLATGLGLIAPGDCTKLAGASELLVTHGTSIFGQSPFQDRNTPPSSLVTIEVPILCLCHWLIRVTDFLNDTRLKIIQGLLQDAMRMTSVNFGINKWSKKFTAANFCKSSQEKYGTFMSRFTLKGIDAGRNHVYSGSWWNAISSIRDITKGTTNGPTVDDGLQEEAWAKKFRAERHYCKPGIKERLKNLLNRQTHNLPGVCLKCFLANEKDDCLRKEYCTKPGHSNKDEEPVSRQSRWDTRGLKLWRWLVH